MIARDCWGIMRHHCGAVWNCNKNLFLVKPMHMRNYDTSLMRTHACLYEKPQWDAHLKVFYVHFNNPLLISAASVFLCVSQGTQWLLWYCLFFFSIHQTVGLLFWAAAASAQAVIKMFSQRLFCSRFQHSVKPKSKRLVKNTGHSRVDWTAMITELQNSIKSSKRTENVQSKTLGGSCADTLVWLRSNRVISEPFGVTEGMLRFSPAKEMHKLTEKVQWTQKRGQKEKKGKKWSVCIKKGRQRKGQGKRLTLHSHEGDFSTSRWQNRVMLPTSRSSFSCKQNFCSILDFIQNPAVIFWY